jgi:hypothetical protein
MQDEMKTFMLEFRTTWWLYTNRMTIHTNTAPSLSFGGQNMQVVSLLFYTYCTHVRQPMLKRPSRVHRMRACLVSLQFDVWFGDEKCCIYF